MRLLSCAVPLLAVLFLPAFLAPASLAQTTPKKPALPAGAAACREKPDKDCVLDWALAEVRREEQDDLTYMAKIAAVWPKPKLLEEAKALAQSRPMGTGRPFNIVARGQSEIGLADKAFRTAGKIPWLTERSQALASVAEALAKRGNLEAALSVARRTPISEYASLGVAHVILAQADKGAIQFGLEDVKQLKIKGRDHLESRSKAFSRIALAFARVGMADEAVAAARSIAKASYAAPTLAGVAALAGRPELFPEAVALAEKGPTDQRDSALAGVAPRMAEAGLFDEALALARKIKRSHLRDAALAGIAPALAGQGREGEALALLGEISRPAIRGSAVFGFAAATDSGDDYEGLLAAARRLDVKTDHQVRLGLAGLLAARGRGKAARDMAQSIYEPRRRAEVLASLALLSGDEGLLGEAAGLAGDYAPALRSLAKAQACLGRPKEAAKIIEGRESRDQRITMLIDLAKCLPPEGPETDEDLRRLKMRPDLPVHGFSPWSPQGAALAAG